MSQITLQLPNSLHRRARELSEQDQVSLDTMIATALSEKIAVLDTVDVLRKRAQRGSRVTFDEAFAESPDVPALDYDEMPGV